MLCNMVRLLIKNKNVPFCTRSPCKTSTNNLARASTLPSLSFLNPSSYQNKKSFENAVKAISAAACLTHRSPSFHSITKTIEIPASIGQYKLGRIKSCVIQVIQIQYIISLLLSQLMTQILILLTKLYINFMTQLNSNILLLCLLPLALAGITNFWDMTPIDQDTLLCLKDSGYLEEAFVLTAFDQKEQQWQVAVDLALLRQTGTKTNLLLSTTQIQGRLPPQLEAHRIARQFESHPVHKFWVGISNFIGGFRPSCAYLRTFALYLHLYTQRAVGFQSELLFWEDLFGDAGACAELGEHQLYLSFNNFKPFGGWSDYQFFETYRPVPVCNYPGMEVFRK